MLRTAACCLLFATCAHASILVQASVSPQPTGPEFLSDYETFSGEYDLTVPSGQGIVAAYLAIFLQGETNEGRLPRDLVDFEGSAGVSSPTGISVPTNDGNPQFNCLGGYGCRIPIVFDQPQTITINAWAHAYFQYMGTDPLPAGYGSPITSYVDLDGIIFLDEYNQPMVASYTLTAMPDLALTPEPSAMRLMLCGGVLLVLASRFRGSVLSKT